MTRPWERLPEETERWFLRFEHFRMMGVGRDLNTAYNQERVAKGLQESSEASGSWRKVAKANRWYERAEAYDAYLTEQAAAEYEARWKKEIMGKVEVLGRISRMGRAKPSDFFNWSSSGRITGFNMSMLEQHGDLVKKLGSKETANGTEFVIELYDGQAAAFQMGRHYKLFTDVQEHNGTLNPVEMTLAEWQAQQAAARKQAGEVLDLFEENEEADA